jgi:cobyrinic acid a,c-diamide synthase
MTDQPRIAIGTTQDKADGTALLWALMDVFETAGVRVQEFLSRACFPLHDGATAITGQSPRHLDSWLMCPEVCRSLFLRGTRSCDLALVEGCFDSQCSAEGKGGSLATLCDWLALPRLATVDVRLLGGCSLPARPADVEGLLLDGVRDVSEACRWQTHFEAHWNVPVLGWLPEAAELRNLIERLPPGRHPRVELCHALGQQLASRLKWDELCRLAVNRPTKTDAPAECALPACRAQPRNRPLQVAVACDEAFGGYFPDTLELLEAKGARVRDFSPLRDDRLPPGTDVVYVGCGHPELYAAALAGNDCMTLSLKSHLCSGRRIYAECGGLAYLAHELEMPDGTRWPMVGALSVTACYHDTPTPPEATELTLLADTWLGQSPQHWRGYLNPHWTISPHTTTERSVAESGHELDVIHRHQAIGSRMYLDFAARLDLLDRFFDPHHQSPPDANQSGCGRL